MNLIHQMFDWPQGIVVGNLIASFMVWCPHFIYVHIAHRKLNSRLDRIEGKQDALRD